MGHMMALSAEGRRRGLSFVSGRPRRDVGIRCCSCLSVSHQAVCPAWSKAARLPLLRACSETGRQLLASVCRHESFA